MKPIATTALLALLATAAQAGPLELTVTDRDGKPAPDVVVLVSTPDAPAVKPAAAPVVIAQQDLKFSPFLTVVPLGSTLRFVNKDSYDHHVRSTPSGPLSSMPAVEYFELRLDAANPPSANSGSYGGYDDYKPAATAPERKKSGKTSADVKVEHAGPIGLGCHIHGSMRGQVYVADTPWFAKTDATGVAQIEGVPDGAAQITVWHPDQLQDQASVPVQVSTTPLSANTQLNFIPKRRRG